jgi:hypothetical protein
MGVPGGGGASPPSLLGKPSQSGNIRSTVGQYWLNIKKWDKFCHFFGKFHNIGKISLIFEKFSYV